MTVRMWLPVAGSGGAWILFTVYMWEYAVAVMELKGENVVLAKVAATEENELSQKYDIQGFTTIHFFIDGVHKPYAGPRTN